MNIKSLIPAHKSDIATVNKLTQLEYPAYKAILGELLKWVRDMNWPVAPAILPLLIKADRDLVPYIQNALNTNDTIWKYWILNEIICKLSKETTFLLKEDLQRLATNPSEADKIEEINLLAKKILEKT